VKVNIEGEKLAVFFLDYATISIVMDAIYLLLAYKRCRGGI